MSFSYPKLLRKLFTDDGKGNVLNDSILPSGLVKFNSSETLTDTEKETARTNIDAQSKSELETALEEIANEINSGT